jgi:hypothetical protein
MFFFKEELGALCGRSTFHALALNAILSLRITERKRREEK